MKPVQILRYHFPNLYISILKGLSINIKTNYFLRYRKHLTARRRHVGIFLQVQYYNKLYQFNTIKQFQFHKLYSCSRNYLNPDSLI